MKHYLPHIVGLLILISYMIADLRAEIADSQANDNSVAKAVLKEASSLRLNQGFLEK